MSKKNTISQSFNIVYTDKPDFDREDIAQAIRNFDYAYDYFMPGCKLR